TSAAQRARVQARHESFKIVPGQHVQPAKRYATGPDFLHPRLVFASPGVSEGKPVDLVSMGYTDPFRLAVDRCARVNERPEHVKKHRPNGGHGCPSWSVLGSKTAPVGQPKIMAKSLIKLPGGRDSNPRPLP